MHLEFSILGDAIPQGSLKAFLPKGSRRPIVTSDNPRLRSWRALVHDAAYVALLAQPDNQRLLADGGVRLTVTFFLPRPQSLPRKVTAHRRRPDLDKLIRAISDALTNICYSDDAQICEVIALKRYAPAGRPARVDVIVEDTDGTATGIYFVNMTPADALLTLPAGPQAH